VLVPVIGLVSRLLCNKPLADDHRAGRPSNRTTPSRGALDCVARSPERPVCRVSMRPDRSQDVEREGGNS
jgi:hypothetical protein